MEFSPYLNAVQQLAGLTYGTKIQSIIKIAEKIIEDHGPSNRPIEVQSSEELPEVLIPIVQLKIAEILKQPEGVLNALTSDDPVIFTSALRVKWFFNGSIENHLNAHDFQHHIFPHVSASNRSKIIKTLSSSLTLRHWKICEEFHSTITKMYNELEAQPFLVNCSASFIDHIITHHAIKFDLREFKILLYNHYYIAVKYLKLCASSDNFHTKMIYPPLETYQIFFIHLLKNNDTTSFVELIGMCKSSPSTIQLRRHFTELFLENEYEILLEKPCLFMPILSLEEVTEKLTESEFVMVFKNMFPKKIEEFDFKNLYSYLKFVPQIQKLPIMLSTFEEVYKVNLLDCHNRITPEVLKELSSSERIEKARKKLETDKNWYTVGENTENSWVCYLPVEESIPILKKQIFKTTNNDQKIELANQMIYSCKVNNDTNALLDVLKYVTTQNKTDGWCILNVLKRLSIDFKIQYLPQEHWNVLNEFIEHYHEKGKIHISANEFQDIVIWGIHYELVNNLSINEKIDFVTEGNINGRLPRWNLFKNMPKFEKLCLEEFMESIPRMYVEIYDNYTWSWPDIVHSFMDAIYDFNKRHFRSKVGSIYIESNPLFSDGVKKLVSGQFENHKYFPTIKQIKQLLKINEPNLYYLWVETSRPSQITVNDFLIQIENNYEDYLNNWEGYYEYCKNHIDEKSIQYFINTSRWYQDLPIKFLEKSLKDIVDDKDNNAVKVLASLVEGPVFEEFIKSQTSNLTDVGTENSGTKHLTKLGIAEALKNITTLPSIEFITQIFEDNDFEIVSKCFYKIVRRIPADKLILFCQMMMNRSKILSKLSINLIHDAATTQQYRHILMDLWRTREHRFIDYSLIKNIQDAFINEPCTETWEMIEECFTNLKIEDRRACKFINLCDKFPSKYIADYIKLLLSVFKNIGDNENSLGSEGVWFQTNYLLQNLPNYIAHYFPEEQHEEILKTYLADLSLPKNVCLAAQKYLINCYILPAENKLDSRLKFFSGLFENVLQNEQEICNVDDSTPTYPVHDFLQGLIINVIPISFSPVKIKLINVILDTFLSVLEPQEAPEFYCKFILASLYNAEITPKEFGQEISQIIPGLIDSLVTSVYITAQSLFDIVYHFYLNLGAEGQLDIVESLLESNHDNNTLLAANLLLWQYFEVKNLSRFWKFVRYLKNHENVAVISCANLILSGFKY